MLPTQRKREREVAKEKQRYSGDEEVGIVAVEPRPNKGVASKVMDRVEKLIVKFMHRFSTPNLYFSGNFAPLPHETPPTTDLLVKGFLPVSPLYFAYTPHSWNYWFGLHAATLTAMLPTQRKREREVAKEKQRYSGDEEVGIVAVEPRPNKGVASKVMDRVEKLIVKFMHRFSTPNLYFSGNFAPLPHETPPTTDLLVKGFLPDCLNGEFVRVGPNPKFEPVAGHHFMIHGLRIKNGKATYVSRYVRTSKLKQEEYFGAAKFMKWGNTIVGKALRNYWEDWECGDWRSERPFGLLMVIMQLLRQKLKVLDALHGTGTANTALVYHHGKLLALQEADKPYVLKVLEDGDIQTLGMLDYDKRLKHSFTAHPKVDPFTGEMFTFGYSLTPPYITYRVISKDGFMHDPVPITISDSIMMHDFAITENYAIFMDHPLIFKPKEMVKEKRSAFTFDATKRARFGILPRYAKDELQIRWFELPNCFTFHNVYLCSRFHLDLFNDFLSLANAWEEEDEVVLITCRAQHPDLDMFNGIVKEKLKNFSNELYEMRFNMKTGLALQKKLSASVVELPRVNESYTSRKSSVHVIDAKTMSADPVAVVEIPHRVPYGFHAFLVTEEQLQEQGKL
ncbi:carotenoid 9 [Quercus suber]|uniref:carotenoid 9,10-dioxygenase n=1 Tax=Quercus suber TaxID=58331 RepID=A0AAW0LFH4_QUESU